MDTFVRWSMSVVSVLTSLIRTFSFAGAHAVPFIG